MSKIIFNLILSILFCIISFILLAILINTVSLDSDIYGQIITTIMLGTTAIIFAISFSTLTILDSIKHIKN